MDSGGGCAGMAPELLRLERQPFVTVIIPTYNRGQLLADTLSSFMSQQYPSDCYEIIIADNNSTDDTRTQAAPFLSGGTVPVSYLLEPRQGVHFARNSAAKIARGEILYFTDDDMIADENLLREIVKPFALDDRIGAVTGMVLPRWEDPPPDWVRKHCLNGVLSLNVREEELLVTSYDCGVYSCHQAIRRDAFFRAGGFNPENTAGEWIGDGETGLNIKIAGLGYRFAFIASSVNNHRIPARRMNQSYLNRRYANQGRCDSYTSYRKHRHDFRNLVRLIMADSLKVPVSLLGCLKYLLLLNHEWRFCRARISYFVARIAANRKLLNDGDRRTFVLRDNWLDE